VTDDAKAALLRVVEAYRNKQWPDERDAGVLGDLIAGPDKLTHDERLELARWMLEAERSVHRWLPGMPEPSQDLLDREAAAREATRDRQEAHLFQVNLDPTGPRLHRHPAADASDDAIVLMNAALFDCRRCVHLRRGESNVQPLLVRLASRSIDCERCAETVRPPRADEDDRCDVCGERGVTEFWPFRFAIDHRTVTGDMCDACRDVLLGQRPGAKP
jgi:hypothetical protein